MTTCATCGRENPSHLTFCQECGQRLGPRIAPPTPPIGLGAEDSSPPYAPPPKDARGATSLGGISPDMPTEVSRPPAFPPPQRRCRVCETDNPGNLRYCTSCGSTLEASAAPATDAPPMRAPSQPPAPIAPARVVDLGGARPSGEARTCQRCRGTVDGGAQFCKFCGAPLGGDASGVAPQAFGHANGRAAPAPVPIAASVAPVPSPSPIGGPAPVAKYGPPPGPAAPAPIAAASGVKRGRLTVIAKSGADGQSYPIGDQLDVGRLEGSIIVGEDPYLSPRHVRIIWNGRTLVLRDLASTNGVYLRLASARDTSKSTANEVAVPLEDQDLILVGQQVLRFELVREAEGGLGPASEHGTLLFGSPASPRYARLTQRTVEGVARDVYYVRKVETVLGRESGDVVFTEDPFLSRRHAAIRITGRDGSALPPGIRPSGNDALRFTLVDLGSSNGTFLRVRGDVELVQGDHFRVGQQLFRVDIGGS